MARSDMFCNELNLIVDIHLQKSVREFLNTKVPDYFFEVPASSTGKYHPKFALGPGGLVRHTKMVVAIANDLCNLYGVAPYSKDMIIAACILHDTFKSGYTNTGHTVTTHPVIAADEWMNFIRKASYSVRGADSIYYGIATHMGKWGPDITIDTKHNDITRIIQLADYMASRKVFDMDILEVHR